MVAIRPSDRERRSSVRKTIAKAWWKCTDADVAKELLATCKEVRRQLSRQRLEDQHHAKLYGNGNVDGRGWTDPSLRMRYNLVRSAIDTEQSIIAQQRPRPQYLTQEGSWDMQRQARLKTQVLEGQLHDLGAYEWGPDAQRDGGVHGTSFVLGCVDDEGCVKLEQLLHGQVLIEHNDGLRMKPKRAYVRWVKPRDALIDEYPEHAKALEKAGGPDSSDREDLSLSLDDTCDQVLVIEAWHLGCEDRPGRHVIATSTCVLLDEDYTGRRLPLSVYRRKTRQAGFYGVGCAEECRDAQWRINRLLKKWEDLSDLGTNGHVVAAREADVRVEQISNEPYRFIEYSAGTAGAIPPPQFVKVDGVPPSLQAEIEAIKAEKFQELGLTQMRTQGAIPPGLNSGKALRAYEDVADSRHTIPGRRYEAFFMDLCDLLEMLNAEAAKLNPSYKVTARTTRGRATLVSQVKWSAVVLPEQKYRLKMWPTSSLPSTPAGKMAMVQEWIDGGWVSRPFAQSLLDFPDMDAALRLELADLDAIMFDVEQILDGKDGIRPDPRCDLEMAADIARRSLLHARVMGAPADVLLALGHFADEALQMVAEAAASQMPVGGPGALPAGDAAQPAGAAGAPMLPAPPPTMAA